MDNANQFPYISDSELFSIWKYANGERLGENLFSFESLIPPKGSNINTMLFISTLKTLGIKRIDGIVFHKDLYLKYNKKEYDYLSKEKVSEKLLNAIDNIFKGNINFNDIESAIWLGRKLNLLEFFEFPTNLSKDNQEKISKFLDFYIKAFIADNLSLEKKNYLKFDRQKEIVVLDLSTNVKEYGKKFILEFNPSDLLSYRVGLNAASDSLLFIHTIVALDYLKYIEIENIWVYDWEVPPDIKIGDDTYKVKLKIKDKFLQEQESKFVKYPLQLNRAKQVISQSDQSKIWYNEESGSGTANNKQFKFKDHQPEYRVFAILYKNIGKKIDRETVLQQIEFYNKKTIIKTKDDKVKETYTINELCKKIRSRTGLTKAQLVNNNGNITLIGVKS